jgi:hypothetical protein
MHCSELGCIFERTFMFYLIQMRETAIPKHRRENNVKLSLTERIFREGRDRKIKKRVKMYALTVTVLVL